MSIGWYAAGAGAAGAAIGGAAGVRHHAELQSWKDQIGQADMAVLGNGQTLPPIPEPSPGTGRRDRGMVPCHLIGMAIGGIGAWIIVFLGALVTFSTLLSDSGTGEIAVAALAVAFVVGLIGLIIPGLFPIGSLLWLKEVRGRMAENGRVQRRQYWENREVLRCQLERGETSPHQAWSLVAEATPWMNTAPESVIGVPSAPPGLTRSEPLPIPGEPVSPALIMQVASAATQLTGGYVRAEEGEYSTARITQRLLRDSQCAERSRITHLSEHNVFEGTVALGWLIGLEGTGEDDDYTRRVGAYINRQSIDPRDSQAVTMLASGVGAHRRAQAEGRA